MKEIEVQEILRAWGEWVVRRDDGGNGYQQMSYGEPEPSSYESGWRMLTDCSDMVLSAVDSAVCELPFFQRTVIQEWYTKARDMDGMLNRLGISKRGFFNYLKDAHTLAACNTERIISDRGICQGLRIVH